MDLSVMETFFEAIYGDASGWVDIVNPDVETGKIDSEMWRRWGDDKAYIAKYCGLRQDEDTYCSVALFTDKARTKDDLGAIANAVWADADTCDPSNFRATPSVIVQTSPGRWHCWWVLDAPVPAFDASMMSQKIAYAHRAQGCDLGWSASKILRVPGTSNNKTPGVRHDVTVEYTGVLYTLPELEALYEDIEATAPVILNNEMPALLSLSERVALEEKVIKDSPFENLYLTPPEESESWWPKLFRLQFDLFREGCTPQEVFTLSKYAACNKFERDHRPDTDLWKTVQNAYLKFVSEEAPVASKVEARKTYTVPDFLTAEERAALPVTFPDKYAQWVGARSDSAESYQRSLAFLLLSCIFGDRGYIPDKFGARRLNLWLLLLGDTTRTRKSTAKSLFLRILAGYETAAMNGEHIDIGSDATKEGLGRILGERDGKVSLFQTDEVNGMFREWYGKNYQIGTLSYFTDLYEGYVPVVLRAGKDAGQAKRARTVFNMLGVGIREHVARTLTKDDFESGFLTRMLWTVADPGRREKGSDNWIDSMEAATDEADVARIVLDLKRRAAKFVPEAPSAIKIADNAKARYNVWAEQVRTHSEEYGDSVLEASVDRFQHSVRKAAALLAMYDGKETIDLPHLLSAIAQSERWYGDMLRMLTEVSSSDFERLLNEVEGFIGLGTNGERADAAVRRKFASLKPQEINDVLNSLKQQGRIRSNGTSQWQVLA
ncbi:MAG: DUF3987 domain-containing protein [Candidatus Paceibacterota bacterium]